MSLKEIIQLHKAEMTPKRRTFHYVVSPICVSVFALLCLAGVVLATMDIDRFFPAFVGLAGAGFCVFIGWLIAGLALAKAEVGMEIRSFSFLFEKPKPLTGDCVTVKDAEEGLTYTLTKSGLKIRFPETEEAVFDETQENVRFLAWDDVEFYTATDNRSRRVWLALGVMDVAGRSVDAEAYEEEMFFVPVTEEVFSAVAAFGLEDKMSAEWFYLQYNPQDAFKQILAKGYIGKMYDPRTGEMFADEDGNFYGDEEKEN